MIYEYYNEKEDATIEIDADSFDEASHVMFGDGEYDYNDWELITIYGKWG